MKTGLITFNCRDRLRKHRGRERHFDAAAMAAVVNSPAVQERVSKGDMHGFYGHMPRVMFGMEPGEAGIHNGRVVNLEPAIATTTLRAFDDGRIEHEAEFLDTASGRLAARVYGSKRGGFSSAITCVTRDGAAVPQEFHGFDFVFEPNFSGNRGYCLDGVLDGEDGDGVPHRPGSVLDSVGAVDPEKMAALQRLIADHAQTIKVLDGMYVDLRTSFDAALLDSERLRRENQELLAILAQGPDRLAELVAAHLAAMDSVGQVPRERSFFNPPKSALRSAKVSRGASSLERTAMAFDSASLASVEERKPAEPERTAVDAGLSIIRRSY